MNNTWGVLYNIGWEPNGPYCKPSGNIPIITNYFASWLSMVPYWLVMSRICEDGIQEQDPEKI